MIEEERMNMIMDHYDNPRNFGAMDDPTVTLRGGNPNCGDSINIYLRVAGDVIEDMSFDGKGCIISQATTSLLSEFVKGKTVGRVGKLDSDYMRKLVGKDLLVTRPRCSRLALETLLSWTREYGGGKTA